MKNELKSFILFVLYLLISVFAGKYLFEFFVPDSSVVSFFGYLYLPVTTVISAAAALLMGGFSIVVLFFKCLFGGKSRFREFSSKVEMIQPPRWPFFVVAVLTALVPALFLKFFYHIDFSQAYFYSIALGVANTLIFIMMAGRNWCYWLIAMWQLGDVKSGEEYRHLHMIPDAQNQIEFAAPDTNHKSQDGRNPHPFNEN